MPAELWLSIFELMDCPTDLNSVVRTCRRFHNYGLRSLHRNLVWEKPVIDAYEELCEEIPVGFWSEMLELVGWRRRDKRVVDNSD